MEDEHGSDGSGELSPGSMEWRTQSQARQDKSQAAWEKLTEEAKNNPGQRKLRSGKAGVMLMGGVEAEEPEFPPVAASLNEIQS